VLSAGNVTQLPVRRVRAGDKPVADALDTAAALHRATRAADADGYVRGFFAGRLRGRGEGLRLGVLIGLGVALSGTALAHIVASAGWLA
jgi:hypothetical protein